MNSIRTNRNVDAYALDAAAIQNVIQEDLYLAAVQRIEGPRILKTPLRLNFEERRRLNLPAKGKSLRRAFFAVSSPFFTTLSCLKKNYI